MVTGEEDLAVFVELGEEVEALELCGVVACHECLHEPSLLSLGCRGAELCLYLCCGLVYTQCRTLVEIVVLLKLA